MALTTTELLMDKQQVMARCTLLQRQDSNLLLESVEYTLFQTVRKTNISCSLPRSKVPILDPETLQHPFHYSQHC